MQTLFTSVFFMLTTKYYNSINIYRNPVKQFYVARGNFVLRSSNNMNAK